MLNPTNENPEPRQGAETARYWSAYDQAVARGLTIDHHESDLYVRLDGPGLEFKREAEQSGWHCEAFTGTDGFAWLEVPFAYYPWWAARATKGA